MSNSLPTSLLTMQRNTNELTCELEDRIKHLISGYEYLDKLSTAVPHDIQDSASQHRKVLLDVMNSEEMMVRIKVFALNAKYSNILYYY